MLCTSYHFLGRESRHFWYKKPIKRVIARYSLGFCDFCRFHTKWRKRTRYCTNSCLRDQRDFCNGGHRHIRLRGRSSLHKCYSLTLLSFAVSWLGQQLTSCSCCHARYIAVLVRPRTQGCRDVIQCSRSGQQP